MQKRPKRCIDFKFFLSLFFKSITKIQKILYEKYIFDNFFVVPILCKYNKWGYGGWVDARNMQTIINNLKTNNNIEPQ